MDEDDVLEFTIELLPFGEVVIGRFTGFGTLTKLEIIPTRMQEIEEKTKFVSCGDSKVEASLSCAT